MALNNLSIKHVCQLLVFVTLLIITGCSGFQTQPGMYPDYKRITGCSGFQTLPECMYSDYKRIILDKAPIFPTKRMLAERGITVIVADFDCNALDLKNNEKQQFSKICQNELKNNLMEMGINIYEGIKRKELIEAAKRNEFLATKSKGLPSVIKYVLFGNIYSVSGSIDYIKGIRVQINGSYVTLPGKCEFNINVMGSIDIYDGVNMDIIDKIDLSYTYKEGKNTTQSHCRNFLHLAKTKKIDAICNAMKNKAKPIIGNKISPVAYVEEVRKNPLTGEKIVRVSCAASQLNFEKNNPVAKFYRLKTQDRITGEKEIYPEEIGSGIFCKNNLAKSSTWVYLQNQTSPLMLGDVVKIIYEVKKPHKSFLKWFFDTLLPCILGGVPGGVPQPL